MDKDKNFELGYILITNLFYPAILGTLFFVLLDDFTQITIDNGKIIYIISSVSIIISFSIDFLYSVASKQFYTKLLFVSDLLILLLLFVAYKNLMYAIREVSSLNIFFICFMILHSIFLLWDLLLIPKKEKCKRIIIFDFWGLFLSIIGYLFFKMWFISGVIFLMIYVIVHLSSCAKEIEKMIKYQE